MVLPEPFGPIRPKTSPRFTDSDRSFTADLPPKLLLTPEALIIAPLIIASVGPFSCRNNRLRCWRK